MNSIKNLDQVISIFLVMKIADLGASSPIEN